MGARRAARRRGRGEMRIGRLGAPWQHARSLMLRQRKEGQVRDNVSVRLIPAAQARDWRQRWLEIQAHLERLRAPRTEMMSAESIQTANHELQSFFVQAYHLKDSLIQDASATGVSEETIEDVITADTQLAL